MSSRETSACPWARPSAFQAVRPCRTRTSRRPVGGSATTAGGDVRGQRDQGAVAPEPLEGVELALLGVLDVHDDLDVVEQDPAAVALALPAHRLGACLAQL